MSAPPWLAVEPLGADALEIAVTADNGSVLRAVVGAAQARECLRSCLASEQLRNYLHRHADAEIPRRRDQAHDQRVILRALLTDIARRTDFTAETFPPDDWMRVTEALPILLDRALTAAQEAA